MIPYVTRVATDTVVPIIPQALHVIVEQSDMAQEVMMDPMHMLKLARVRRMTRVLHGLSTAQMPGHVSRHAHENLDAPGVADTTTPAPSRIGTESFSSQE
eukprot:SAG31_NODE_1803_length_7238_cov_3.273988_4_plen_100_part_00